MTTTIQIDNELKKKLDTLKIHHRESYNELIFRLVKSSSPNNLDRESLIETIEVLSDPETMKELAEALKEKSGTSLEEFERGL
jgi:predicted CopG family antitoxin